MSVVYGWMIWRRYPMSVMYGRMFENVTQCQLYTAECLKTLSNVSCIWQNVWKCYRMLVVYGRMFENIIQLVVYGWMFENVIKCQLYMAECLKMLPNVSCILLNVWKHYPVSCIQLNVWKRYPMSVSLRTLEVLEIQTRQYWKC